MQQNWLILWQEQNISEQIIETNQLSQQFGLIVNAQEARLIAQAYNQSLQEQERVEFGSSVISKIIYEFCNSDYLSSNNYVDSIIRLQEIFFLYKNEMKDEITDDELLHLMRQQFENLCYGDLDYLANTCLYNFGQAIRAGYQTTGQNDEYSKFDEIKRWDYELYLAALNDICWS